MNLEQLQAALVQELRGVAQPALRRQIVPGGMSPARRLAIYRNNAAGACRKALALIYPVCHRVIGEACCAQLASQYSEAHPSRQADLNGYGEYWPAFLAQRMATDRALRVLPYLPDLARLEWLYHGAYYADDDPAMDFAALQRVLPSRQGAITWHCSAALAVIESAYPLHAIWQGNREGRGLDTVSGLSEPEYLCIYRRGFEPVVDVIDSTSHALLAGILNGLTMAQLQATADAVDIDSLLPRWVQCGWVCGFSLAPAR